MQKKFNTNFILGIFFIIAAIILCLNFLNIDIIIDKKALWWGLLALAGVTIMINDRRLNIISSLMIVVGVWNVLKVCGIVTGNVIGLIWPIILVVIGINLMFNQKIFTKIKVKERTE